MMRMNGGKAALWALAFLFVAGTGRLFAQFTWSGFVDTGVALIWPEEGSSLTTESTDFALKSEGVDGRADRLRLYGDYNQSNYGLNFGLYFDVSNQQGKDYNNQANGFYPLVDNYVDKNFQIYAGQHLYAWGDFFNRVLRITGGKLGDQGRDLAWAGGLDENFNLEEFKTGLRLEVKPLQGLNFGVLLKAPPFDASADEKYTLQRAINEMIFGARYDHAQFSLSAALALDGLDNDNADEEELVFGFKYTGVPQLITGVEAWFGNIAEKGENVRFQILEQAGYQLLPQMYGKLKIYEEKTDETVEAGHDGVYIRVYPDLYYKVTPRLEPSLELGFTGYTDDFGGTFAMAVKPKLYYHLGANATFLTYFFARFIHEESAELGVTFYWSF